MIQLFFILLTFNALATDHLIYMGAGGEGKKDSTIFDPSIQNMANYVAKSPELKISVALNGGHSKTEKIIESSFLNAVSKTSFLASDYKRLIDSYKSKLEKNEITSGDQLLIYIDSHGAENTGPSKSHTIATSEGAPTNLDSLTGSTTVDLDELIILKDLAKSKGVKLAILDMSCHSGNTQNLADENTCVISATGPKHYGYASFSTNFSAAMKKGKTLEDIYLEVRAQDTTPALPMISTQAGEEVTKFLYQRITPFLYYFDATNDKFTPFLEKGSPIQCQEFIQDLESVEKLLTSTKNILGFKKKHKSIDIKVLKRLILKYENSYNELKAEMKMLDTQRLKKVESFKSSTQSANYTWKELITTDFKLFINNMQLRLTAEKVPYNQDLIKGLISVYEQAETKKNILLKTMPDLRDLSLKEAAIKAKMSSQYAQAAAIGTEERKLYSALYKSYQSSLTPNPCRDFKLR